MDSMHVPFNREQALEKLKEKVTTDWLFKHSLAAGAVMRAIAERLDENPDTWEVIGLLHDIDFDQTSDDAARHTMLAGEWLKEWGFGKDVVHSVMAHNHFGDHGLQRSSKLDMALSASESITGLVVAAALVQPDKKLASVKPKSVKKKMKEKAFARNVSREEILQCEELGIPIAEFCEISVGAMQNISDDLGL
jgi:putative nucleotidyltransferase with HDIG domain